MNVRYSISSQGSPSVVYHLENKVYLNITNRCTNECYFCLRKFKSGIAGFNLRLQSEPTLQEIKRELKAKLPQGKWDEIVFCGFGEPTIRIKTLLKASNWINKKFTLPICLNTNGHALLLYQSRDIVKQLKDSGISRLSISLNAHNRDLYNEVCKPVFENAFEKVVEFIELSRDIGFDIQVTAVTIPEISVSAVKELASRMAVKFKPRLYHPCIW